MHSGHRSPMGFRHYAPAVAVLIALAAPGTAAASDYAPSHVIVRYQSWTTRAERVAAERATGTGRAVAVGGGARRLQIGDGEPVWRTVAQLRAQPGVDYAVPDYRIHSTTAYFPNDPGRAEPATGARCSGTSPGSSASTRRGPGEG